MYKYCFSINVCTSTKRWNKLIPVGEAVVVVAVVVVVLVVVAARQAAHVTHPVSLYLKHTTVCTLTVLPIAAARAVAIKASACQRFLVSPVACAEAVCAALTLAHAPYSAWYQSVICPHCACVLACT